jgi:hypothetical protein
MVDDNFDDALGWWEEHFNTTALGRRVSWAKFVQEGQNLLPDVNQPLAVAQLGSRILYIQDTSH